MSCYKKLVLEENLSYNEQIYKSESATADRNKTLGYIMQEKKSFQCGKDKAVAEAMDIDWGPNSLADTFEL